MNPGVLHALIAFSCWGLYPLYFLLITSVPALEVVLHRSVWSLLCILMVLAWLRRWAWLRPLLREPKRLAVYGLSALLIAVNWLVYVHAMQTHQVLEGSLGYFINPLFSVALGVLVLRERLRWGQWMAVALAALGVAWLTWRAGGLPWIALALASLFSLYGLVRKMAPLGALEGLAVETMLLAPIALLWLAWLTVGHTEPVVQGKPWLMALLMLSGPVTVLPLVLFASAARQLTLATVGVLQYVSPTLQFILGVWVFGEMLDAARLLGFAFIWAGLAVYSLDAIRTGKAADRRAGGFG